MRNTQPISVTLPHDMAAMVKAKVTSGEYASESEVIRDGLRDCPEIGGIKPPSPIVGMAGRLD
jgi:Arc/MetJ-type ribon-helix-helix transcriptional regulator